MSSLLKNLIIALSVVLVMGVLYYFFILNGNAEGNENLTQESEAVRETARILADTKKIGGFNMNGDILRDDRFTALKKVDITAELTDVGTGRSNPFEVVR